MKKMPISYFKKKCRKPVDRRNHKWIAVHRKFVQQIENVICEWKHFCCLKISVCTSDVFDVYQLLPNLFTDARCRCQFEFSTLLFAYLYCKGEGSLSRCYSAYMFQFCFCFFFFLNFPAFAILNDRIDSSFKNSVSLKRVNIFMWLKTENFRWWELLRNYNGKFKSLNMFLFRMICNASSHGLHHYEK